MIKEKYSITDKLGFRISACDVTGFFPSIQTREEWREGLYFYCFHLCLGIKCHNKASFSVIKTNHRVL